jgi:hypothetical protein
MIESVPEDFEVSIAPIRVASILETDTLTKYQQIVTEITKIETPRNNVTNRRDIPRVATPVLHSESSTPRARPPRVPTPRMQEKENAKKEADDLRAKIEQEKKLKQQKRKERQEKERLEEDRRKRAEMEEQARLEEEERLWQLKQAQEQEEEARQAQLAEEQYQEMIRQLEQEKERQEAIERQKRLEEERRRKEEELLRLEAERKLKEEVRRRKEEEERRRREAELRRKEEERKRIEEEERLRQEEERRKREEIQRVKNEQERQRREAERQRELEAQRLKKLKEEEERKKKEEEERIRLERKIFEEQTAKFFRKKTASVKQEKLVLTKEAPAIEYQEVKKHKQDTLLEMLKEWQTRELQRKRPRSRQATTKSRVQQIAPNYNKMLDRDTIELKLFSQEKGTHISIVSEEITRVAEDAFVDCPELKLLVLDNNQIQDAFGIAGLCELRFLSMNVNKLKSLERIHECTKLLEYNANNNQINTLENLLQCKELRLVDLSNNSLSSLDIFRPNSTLLRLDIHANSLKDLTGIELLENLCSLNVGFNKIQNIDTLENNPLIDDLVLYRNALTKFPDFSSVLIRNIYLEKNLMEHFNNRLFAPLLELLKLNDNNIQSIAPLSSCINLKLLAISANNISELSDLLSLRPCRMLNTLYISNNPVVQLPGFREVLISLLPNLTTIDTEKVPKEERETCETKFIKFSPRITTQVISFMRRSVYNNQNLSLVHASKWKQCLQLERQRVACKNLAITDWDKRSTYQYLCNKQLAERPKSSINEINKGFESKMNEKNLNIDLYTETREAEIRRKLVLQKRHLEEQLHFQGKEHQQCFVRNNQHHRKKAASCLQRHFREFMARRNVRRNKAAIKIQSLWRGGRTRTIFLPQVFEFVMSRARAAATIQAMVRGFKTRVKFEQGKRIGEFGKIEAEDMSWLNSREYDDFQPEIEIRDRKRIFDEPVPKKLFDEPVPKKQTIHTEVYRPNRSNSSESKSVRASVEARSSSAGNEKPSSSFPPINVRSSWTKGLEDDDTIQEEDELQRELDMTSMRSSQQNMADVKTRHAKPAPIPQHKQKIAQHELDEASKEWHYGEAATRDMLRYKQKLNKLKPKAKNADEKLESFKKMAKRTGHVTVPQKSPPQETKIFQPSKLGIRTPSSYSMRDDIEVQSVTSVSSSGSLSHRAKKLGETRFPSILENGSSIPNTKKPPIRKKL